MRPAQKHPFDVSLGLGSFGRRRALSFGKQRQGAAGVARRPGGVSFAYSRCFLASPHLGVGLVVRSGLERAFESATGPKNTRWGHFRLDHRDERP